MPTAKVERARLVRVWTHMAVAVNFIHHLREDWYALKRGRPGNRFQERFERARAHRECGACQRIALVIAALVCLAVAIFLSVVPGPAIPFFFFAGGLLAAESRTIARIMDWSEVQGRRVLATAKRQWRQWPLFVKVGVTIIGLGCSALLTYSAYRLMRG